MYNYPASETITHKFQNKYNYPEWQYKYNYLYDITKKFGRASLSDNTYLEIFSWWNSSKLFSQHLENRDEMYVSKMADSRRKWHIKY